VREGKADVDAIYYGGYLVPLSDLKHKLLPNITEVGLRCALLLPYLRCSGVVDCNNIARNTQQNERDKYIIRHASHKLVARTLRGRCCDFANRSIKYVSAGRAR